MLAEIQLSDLTIREAAQRLGVHPRVINRMILKKQMRAYKQNPLADSGSPWLIPEDEVQRIENLRRKQLED